VSVPPALAQPASDPLYRSQWHLNDTRRSINVLPVWTNYRGRGINIAIIDSRILGSHEDLRANFSSALSHNYHPDETIITENHGTLVAGVAAARGYNNIGVRGVAPAATVYSLNPFDNDFNGSLEDEVNALLRNHRVTAVYNGSYGPVNPLRPISRLWRQAVESGISQGFHGRGSVYVYSAGNSHSKSVCLPRCFRGRCSALLFGEERVRVNFADNANYNGKANHHGVIAVCAVNSGDRRSSYSEVGDNLWVCAPSGDSFRPGIPTTDLTGTFRKVGRDRCNRRQFVTRTYSGYNRGFSGTSAAAPIVSGVVALLREANPELTWRDIKLILAASARKNNPDHASWQEGAYQYRSDSQKYTFSRLYGFGVVNAKAAVDLARTWQTLPPLRQERHNSSFSARTIHVQSDMDFIEHLDIYVTMRHPAIAELEATLRSPSGAVSDLFIPAQCSGNYCTAALAQLRTPINGTWRFGSSRHLGENPSGTWTLTIRDTKANDNNGVFQSWGLGFRGLVSPPPLPILRIASEDTLRQSELNRSSLLLRLRHATWAQSLNASSFRTTDNSGFSVRAVRRLSDSEAQLSLAFNSSRLNQSTKLSIAAEASAILHHTRSLVSNEITIIPDPILSISANRPLNESDLDGARIDIKLSHATWERLLFLSYFRLSSPLNVRFEAGFRLSDTELSLFMGFDGSDFDQNSALNVLADARAFVNYDQSLASNRLAITANRNPRVLRSIPVPQGAVGSEYSLSLANNIFSDPDGDALSYRISPLPAGLDFNTTTNTIYGTPQETSSHHIELVASDPNGETASTVFTIEVKPPGYPIVVRPLRPRAALPGQLFELDLIAEQVFRDSSPSNSLLTYSAEGLPPWLTFEAPVFSGIPGRNSTSSTVTITATDRDGHSTSTDFRLNIGLRIRAKVFLEGSLQ